MEGKKRYILINDYYTIGGTEVQSKRELEYFLKAGHEVMYITFDPNLKYHESRTENHLNLSQNYKITDRFLCNKKNYVELKNIIKDFKPDFIHLNNIYLSAPAVYKAVKDIYCIQTIRDYSCVCPKSTCVLRDNTICTGMKYKRCIKNCVPFKPKELIKFLGKYLALIRNKKLKKEAVDLFLSPSQKLTDYCNDHDYKTECVNNPFDFRVIKDFNKIESESKKIYLYYGVISKVKGITQLVEAFKKFAVGKEDVELHIIGKVKDLSVEELNLDDKIKYFEALPYDKMLEKLQSVYSVVVPSLWIENYPNTVLEGFATRCIVLASDRGGMVEQVEDKRCIFDVLNCEDIIRALEYSYNLNEKEKNELLKEQYKYLEEHNTQDKYYKKILEMVEKL